MSNMNDYRVAWALKQGDTIQTTDTIYTTVSKKILTTQSNCFLRRLILKNQISHPHAI